MIGPTDLLYPSPTPHFKTFQVFLIHWFHVHLKSVLLPFYEAPGAFRVNVSYRHLIAFTSV
jgi:hypothetical protein